MRIRDLLKSPSLLVASSLLIWALPGLAESPVPANSQQPSGEYIYRMFAGKSADWGGGSYAYWGPDGTFYSASLADQSLGHGRWYATNAGRMCYEADWVWKQDFGLKQKVVKTCTRYRMDAKGDIWSTSGGMSGPWFPFNPAGLSPGDSVAPLYNSLYAEMGLPVK